jgi:methylated-DNA-[protein]-cysteine S-methyltransferase
MDRVSSYLIVVSPIGELTLVARAADLIEIRLPGEAPIGPVPPIRETPPTRNVPPARDVLVAAAGVLDETRRQLDEYFAGRRTAFELPLRAAGTPWQQEVWAALSGIPYGEVVTYGDVARRLGRPAAARAVGRATGQNPLPIVVPCHRVIGADGGLTGYGGGLEAKRRLLALERAAVPA